jgi:hypothetical protein
MNSNIKLTFDHVFNIISGFRDHKKEMKNTPLKNHENRAKKIFYPYPEIIGASAKSYMK